MATVSKHMGTAVELQTKRTRFRSAVGPVQSIDLFSVVHYADASYYRDLNVALCDNYDAVYFECLTAARNTSTSASTALKVLRRNVGPSRAASSEAQAIGAVPQMSILDCLARPNFYVADLTAEELANVAARVDDNQGRQLRKKRLHSLIPLIAESSLRVLRATCFLLPCPELAILLVDYIQSGAGSPALPRAPVFLFALLRGDVLSARRVLFSLVVQATTADKANSRVDDLATRRRNLRVLECIRAGTRLGFRNIAVVYGAWHGDNLGRLFEKNLGMDFDSSSWQTALVAETARNGVTWAPFWSRISSSPSSTFSHAGNISKEAVKAPLGSIVALLVILGVFAGASGLDYLNLLGSVTYFAENRNDDNSIVVVALYIARHAPTYFVLRQWLLRGGEDRM